MLALPNSHPSFIFCSSVSFHFFYLNLFDSRASLYSMGGSWDCHCALCCGPLNICCVHIGERDGGQGQTGGPNNSSDSEDCAFEPPYSPSLVSTESVQWIHQCRALCYDSSNEAVFLSGLGHYDDYGYFEIREPGNDPHDTDPDMYHCYEDDGEWEVLTFPFHEACYRVLAERLGYDKSSEIDTYTLYKVFKQYNNSVFELGLDYGGVQTVQTWDSRRGEEVRIAKHLLFWHFANISSTLYAVPTTVESN